MPELSPLTQRLIKNLLKEDSSELEALSFYAVNSIKKEVKLDASENEEYIDSLFWVSVLQGIFDFDHKEAVKYTLENEPQKINQEKLKELLSSSLGKRLSVFCKKQKLPYQIIGDILTQQKKKLKNKELSPEKVEEWVEKYFQKRIDLVRKENEHIILKTTLYSLLGGILIIFITDAPIALLSPFALIPPLFSSLLIFTATNPPRRNIKKLTLEIIRILYKNKNEDPLLLRDRKNKKNTFLLINTLYLSMFAVMSLLLVWALYLINVPLLFSISLLLIFIYVAHNGRTAKRNLKDFFPVEKKENLLDFFLDVFSLPLIKALHIFSTKKRKPLTLKKVSSIGLPQKSKSLYKNSLKSLKEKKEKLYDE